MKPQLDLSGIKQLKKHMSKLQSDEINWGYPNETDMHSSGLSQGRLAEILNDGVRNPSGSDKEWRIPPRPALMASAMSIRKELERSLKDDVKRFYEGGSTNALYTAVGRFLVQDYQETMTNWIGVGTEARDNADSTIRQKGFNQPFVETGEHIAAATFEIV